MVDIIDDVLAVGEIQGIRNLIPRRIIHDRLNPYKFFDENKFRKRYRLKKDNVRHLTEMIAENLKNHIHVNDVSPKLQVLIALRYKAKGNYQLELGDLHGVSQPTVSRIVAQVSRAIAVLLPLYIRFPDRTDTLKENFYSIANFPNVIGCIDCTHIRIKCPNHEQGAIYINRKGFHSLNVQVVCDTNRKILDIVARWRGSVHDSRIWNNCLLKEQLEEGRIRGVLLGDAGYALSTYLLTPFLNPATPAEERYNRAHKKLVSL